MKPRRKAIQVLFKSIRFPEGVLAWVDFDRDEPGLRLKWHSENEEVQGILQSAISSLRTYGFNHYDVHDGNPCLTAALHVAKKCDITILTKATPSLGGLVEPYAPEDGCPRLGIRSINDPIPTLDEIKQQLTPEERQWVESLSEPEIAVLKEKLTKFTPEVFIDILLDRLEDEERNVEKMRQYQQNPALRRPLELPWMGPYTRPEERSLREQEIKAKTARFKTYMSAELRQWFEELPLEEQCRYGASFYDEMAHLNIRTLEYTRAYEERIERMYFNGEKQIFP